MPPTHFLWLLLACLVASPIGAAVDEKDDSLDADADDDSDESYECPPAFGSRCTCGKIDMSDDSKYRGSFVTNCTDSNFTDTAMLTSLPEATEVLIFTGNPLITELPTNLFGNGTKKSFEKLHLIDFSNNNIRSIKGRTFHHVKKVKKLILDNNHLTIMGENFHPRIFSNFESLEELHLRNAFAETTRQLNFMEDLITVLNDANLTKLKVLNLENNGIQLMPNQFAICSLPALTKLLLGGNYLTDIRLNVSCTPKLILLDVSDNFISSLSNQSLAFLPNSIKFHVNLTRNPLRCDCHLVDMHRWVKLTKTWVIGNKTLQCASGFPESNMGRLFNELEESELQCSPLDEEDLQGYVTASFAVLISLVLALIVLIGALLFSHKEQVVKVWTTLTDSMAAKREYTSLNQEQHHKRIHQVHPRSGVEEIAV